jgi:hypothetical protein
MKCSKRSFSVVSALFAVLLSLSMGTLNARDADLASLTFAAAQTAKQQCINICRSRYRDCRSMKQIPSFECRGVYQDCKRYTCDAVRGVTEAPFAAVSEPAAAPAPGLTIPPRLFARADTQLAGLPLLMLWTAPPPAHRCHGCGRC